MIIKILKKIKNNKFSKIIEQNNLYYIYGIETININKNLNKFVIFFQVYDLNFEFIKKVYINHNFNESTLIWEIFENKHEYIFLIEQKSVNLNIHQCKFYKYYIKKEYLEDFKIEKIEKIELENYLISTIHDNIFFSSKIEIDEERPDYYWGKYLFCFLDNKKDFYKPIFDDIIDYNRDKGHIIHYIEENTNIDLNKCEFDYDGNCFYKKYFIIFSIRHKYENKNEYYYKIYSCYSDDLKYFYFAKEIKIENNITNSEWYCYPEIFKKDDKYYILLNQDDFGKEKETLLGELIFD